MRDAGMRGCEDPKQLVAWLLLRQAGRLVQRMIDTVCDAVIAVTKQIGTVCDAPVPTLELPADSLFREC